MKQKYKIWIRVITTTTIVLLLLITILYNFLSNKIDFFESEINSIILNDPIFQDYQDIPIDELQEYSDEFDYTLRVITDELPEPLNIIAYSYIDQKSMGNIRRELGEQGFSTFTDIISYISQILSGFLAIVTSVISSLVVLLYFVIIILLRVHEKHQRKKIAKDYKAAGEGKVIL